jgi:cytochrome b561
MTTSLTIEADTTASERYTLTAQALHWVTAALMFTVLPLAWVMVSMKDTSPSRGLLFTMHKSVGLTILALAAVRLERDFLRRRCGSSDVGKRG